MEWGREEGDGSCMFGTEIGTEGGGGLEKSRWVSIVLYCR